MKIIKANADFFSKPVTLKDAVVEMDEKFTEFYFKNAVEKEIYISNTLAEEEKISNTKHISICLENCENLTLDGRGAGLLFHGKMSQIAVINCKNITLKNFTANYLNPTVAEMTVTKVGGGYIEGVAAKYSPFKIKEEKIYWLGENFEFSSGISQIYRESTGRTWRHFGPMQDKAAVWSITDSGKIRIDTQNRENPYGVEVGDRLQMRQPTRDENGILISGSEGVLIENVTMYFMHGLGLIAQNSKDIALNGLRCLPSEGRTCACFADFLHFSGCRGDIKITDGEFCGAHDDAVNVHGTHLKITQLTETGIKVKFMHPQTYGINGFKSGDIIDSVNPETLLAEGSAAVKSVTEINPYELLLETENLQGEFKIGNCVENTSATARVNISGNVFDRIPTRGILVTTRKPVVIENNLFKNIRSACVLVSDDASSWYESGYVRDVTVKNNKFTDFDGVILSVKPENSKAFEGKPVHKGIKLIDNEIEKDGEFGLIYAKSTGDITVKGNKIIGKNIAPKTQFEDCENVSVE